jgi:group I intron endonuclease
MIHTIYKSVNTKNGKVYIGFDSNWPNRMRIHKSASKNQDCKFYRAIRKYGWDSFQWSPIYQSHDKEHTLKVMERFFIEEHDSFHNGYNSTLGGDGVFGLVLSQESRKRISEGNKIPKPQTPEHIKKRADAQRGKKRKPLSEEIKQKISKSSKGISKPMTEKHKKNLQCHTNNSIKVSCPHCDKVGQLTNMKKWHFDKCKSNPTGPHSSAQKV